MLSTVLSTLTHVTLIHPPHISVRGVVSSFFSEKRSQKAFVSDTMRWENSDLSLYVQDSLLTCMCRPDIPFHVLGGKRRQTERRNHLITHAFPNHLQWSKPLRTSQGAHVLARRLQGRSRQIDLVHVWSGWNAVLGRGNR